MAERVQRVRAPVAGLDADNSPDYIADGYAQVLDNMLPRGGKALMRGGWAFKDTTNSGLSATLNNATGGLMVFDDQFLMRLPGATFQEHWNLTTGIPTNLAATPAINSRRYAREGAYVYGPGTPTPGNGVQLLRWPGGAVLPTSISSAIAPAGACDVATHLERVWVMGATLGGAGGVSSLMWSIPGGTTATPVVTDWKDPISGLFNQILVGVDDNDDLVAFGKAARSLVVFKKRSIYVLSGQTTATFQIRRFSDQLGCIDRDSVCSFNDGTYFLSERGLMYFDGAQVDEVSKPVRAEIQYAIRRAKLYSAFPYFSVGDIGNGCLMVLIGNYSASPGTVVLANTVPFAQYIYDTVRNTWTKFSVGANSDNLASQPFKPDLAFWCNDKPLLNSGTQYGYADHIVNPEFPLTPNGGYDTYWGSGITNKSIPARWYSRLFPLDSPINTSQVRRLMVDYRMLTSSTVTPAICWTVDLLDGSGTSLLSGPAPAGASGTTPDQIGLYRQRLITECFEEASDVQVRLTYPDQGASPPTITEASIFDSAIEYRTTQQTGVGIPPS